jgi:phenylalanyl-tRNA synthetase alpha chain
MRGFAGLVFGAGGAIKSYSTSSKPELVILNKKYPTDEWANISPSIIALTDRKLHLNESHPIGILRKMFENQLAGLGGYTFYNEFGPVVSKYENFDVLGFPEDHVGRSKTDTYYINRETLLRTHTSAHESFCYKECKTPGYLVSADVYRRDTVDRTHYPAFHQMEGAYTWSRIEHGDNIVQAIRRDLEALPKPNIIVEDPNPAYNDMTNPKEECMSDLETELVSQHLKRTIELLLANVFDNARKAAIAAGSKDPDLEAPLKARWIEAYFPWTTPSYEIEIWWKGEWLEMCGCGVERQHVLKNVGITDKISWAFGIGLERMAMLLFGIPDIRLFWSQDPRFLSQFKPDTVTSFKPYSKYPGTLRDVAFWVDEATPIHENDIMSIVRDIAGDLVENVSLIDEFVHPKTKRTSQCYRINYQSMDRSLTNAEINELQEQVRARLVDEYGLELR